MCVQGTVRIEPGNTWARMRAHPCDCLATYVVPPGQMTERRRAAARASSGASRACVSGWARCATGRRTATTGRTSAPAVSTRHAPRADCLSASEQMVWGAESRCSRNLRADVLRTWSKYPASPSNWWPERLRVDALSSPELFYFFWTLTVDIDIER